MNSARRTRAVVVGLAAVLSTGCPAAPTGSGDTTRPTAPAAGYDKGAREAAEAVAAGTLKLKEYPPLPSPAEHGEYISLLKERCGVGYEVPGLPAGVAAATFVQEVGGWNEVVQAEVRRKFGADVFVQLHEEARKRWQDRVNSRAKKA